MDPGENLQFPQASTRRAFLKTAAAAVAGASTAGRLLPAYGDLRGQDITIILDPDDTVANQVPVDWALGELEATLKARGLASQIRRDLAEVAPDTEVIIVASPAFPLARQVFKEAMASLSPDAEALALVPSKAGRRRFLLVCGSDARGLVYAVLELADRLRLAVDPLAELRRTQPANQKPANQIRSVARLFASEVEDKPWFNDRVFWKRYLTELATHRFNRFSLTLGLGYDFTTDIQDAYFHFAYPFLISVPGYDVRAVPLPDAERARNLEQLQFISSETARRGLHFQLGLWTHAYQWVDSPKANYTIAGLTPQMHAPYCREALKALLQACPAIHGVTLRIHGESGVAEGSYDFWKFVFAGVRECGRVVEIDMHAKGMDQPMIDLALATGVPLNISPKFWAEHQGLGYMQGAIRPQELPPRDETDRGFFGKSSGSRRFLRYGYGDLLAEDRRYGVLHRVWPGTQRLLLGSDPELAADYGRASSFCGSAGVEWCEPLSFKGRKGSGLPGGREAYADPSLRPASYDFEKYLYTYRVWGRRIYDPNCAPEEWRRWLRNRFGAAAASLEIALREAGRILPLITTAHCPSAANNNYWPEMYTSMAIVDAKRPHPYSDTLSPKRFGAVSSLDPEFFSRVDDYAEELVRGEPGAKYSPAWVAAVLESHAADANTAMARAKTKIRDSRGAEFRRVAADVAIQSGLGYFFAWKFRAAVLFAVWERSRSQPALEQAVKAYRPARAAWAEFAGNAKAIYRSDVTFGPGAFQRGHWLDRLPAIDNDLADMVKRLSEPGVADPVPHPLDPTRVAKSIAAVLHASTDLPPRTATAFLIPKSFRRGQPLTVVANPGEGRKDLKLTSLRLRFRRVNQAEIWQVQEMEPHGRGWRATIADSYTDSPFPLQCHFELRDRSATPWLFPGLKPGWQGQPYFVIRQSSTSG